MALVSVAAYVNLGSLLNLGGKTLTDTNSTAQAPLGTLSIQVDGFGYHRIFRYVRVMVASQVSGMVLQRCALVTGTTDGTAAQNSTTNAHDAANFTAGNEAGKIFQVNVAGAAAPEGECAIVGSNTAGDLSFDSRYPLSVALDVGDTYTDWGVAHSIAGTLYSAAPPAENNINCSGVLMGSAPAALDYAWVQVHGFHPAVSIDPNSAAITTNAAAAMGASSTAILLATGASQQGLYIGWFPMATSTTAVQAAMVVDVFGQAAPVA
jgi:hypothetical protein